MGHLAAECPKRNKEVVHHFDHHVDDEDDHVRNLNFNFKANDVIYKILLGTFLDTGSPVSIIREQFIPKNFIIPLESKCNINIVGINKSSLRINGYVKGSVYFEEEEINLKIYVLCSLQLYLVEIS